MYHKYLKNDADEVDLKFCSPFIGLFSRPEAVTRLGELCLHCRVIANVVLVFVPAMGVERLRVDDSFLNLILNVIKTFVLFSYAPQA